MPGLCTQQGGPAGWGAQRAEQAQETRISPDEASEGPAGQHQDTGQGQSEGASAGCSPVREAGAP